MTWRTIALLLFVCLCCRPAATQGSERATVATTHLRGNVYLLATRAGTNHGACVGEDGVLLVDSGYAELAGEVKNALAAISDRPVRYLVNTHWHFDHVGGNEGFANGLIVAHDNARERMLEDRHIDCIDVDAPAAAPAALPALTFSERVTFHLNGEVVEVFHLPEAHTGGDAAVRFREANVIHTGDVVFYPGYPFIDLANGGSIDGLIEATETLVGLCDDQTKVIPGHGPLLDRTGLLDYSSMLKEFRAAIAREIETGLDLPAILEARPTAELDAVWGSRHFPPAKFTELVYRSLTKE